jgi:S-adenosylmethionine/arginine decarboxylase-like enzyme
VPKTRISDEGMARVPVLGELLLQKESVLQRHALSKIDTNILTGPIVIKGTPNNLRWTGFDIVEKSHIAIHTFEEEGLISTMSFPARALEEKRNISLRVASDWNIP